jgi:hypothetical protein
VSGRLVSWVRLDVGFYRHPKAIEAGAEGRDLFLALVASSFESRTDGALSTKHVRSIARSLDLVAPEAIVERLVDLGLLDEKGDGYVVHDYADWQTPSEVLRERAEANAARVAKYRAKRRLEAVPDVDENA